MINIIKTFIAVILAVLLTLGAVYNRDMVEISLGPVLEPRSLPLYLVVYSALLAGFLLGIGYGWLHYGPIGRWSRERSRKKREKVKQARRIVREAEKYNMSEGDNADSLNYDADEIEQSDSGKS